MCFLQHPWPVLLLLILLRCGCFQDYCCECYHCGTTAPAASSISAADAATWRPATSVYDCFILLLAPTMTQTSFSELGLPTFAHPLKLMTSASSVSLVPARCRLRVQTSSDGSFPARTRLAEHLSEPQPRPSC